jgi:diguanylate cyclase (GGDEF)-like protein
MALQTLSGLADAPWRSVSGFPLYFLALALASLRMNWRISAFAGAFAVLQYASLLALTFPRVTPDAAVMPQIARLATLAAAAYLGAIVVLRAQQLQNLSTTDYLTGLANRATLEARLAQELSRARRHERKFAIALVDVDAFKAFNDTFGHPKGDRALQSLATLMQSTARDSDLVARFGGEEFAILLPETGVLEAHAKLEALRARTEASELVDDVDRPMTFTAGIATFPTDGSSAAQLLAAADARLYAGKKGGRNRVVSSRA